MDLNVYVLGIILPFLLTLLALLSRVNGAGGYILAGMSAIGGLIGLWFFLGIGADGDLTQVSSGVSQVIASPTLSQATWNMLTLIPLAFALMAFMSALYRGWQAL